MGTATQPALDPNYGLTPDAQDYYIRTLGEEASWAHSIDQAWGRVFDPAARYEVIAAWFVERNKSWCHRLPENIEKAARELAKTTLPLEIFERLFAGRIMVGDLSQFKFIAMFIAQNTPASQRTAGTPVEPEIYEMFKPHRSAMSGCASSIPTNLDIILGWDVSARIVLHELTHWIDDQLLFGGNYTLRARGVSPDVQDKLAEMRLGMEMEFAGLKERHTHGEIVPIVSRYALLDSCEWFAESLPKYVQKSEEYEENKSHWPATWGLLDYIFREMTFK